MGDDFRQLAVADVLINALGGTQEACWALAGELVAEGMSARDIFVGATTDGPLADRHAAAHQRH